MCTLAKLINYIFAYLYVTANVICEGFEANTYLHAYKLTIDANRSTSCTNTCKYTYMHIYMHCGKCALAHTTLCAECRIRTHDLLIQVVHKSPATIGQLRGSCQKPYGLWAHIHTCIHTCIQLWFQFCTDKLTHAIFSFTIYLGLFIIHPRAEAEWWHQNTSFTRSVILSFPKVDSSQTSKQSINFLNTPAVNLQQCNELPMEYIYILLFRLGISISLL